MELFTSQDAWPCYFYLVPFCRGHQQRRSHLKPWKMPSVCFPCLFKKTSYWFVLMGLQCSWNQRYILSELLWNYQERSCQSTVVEKNTSRGINCCKLVSVIVCLPLVDSVGMEEQERERRRQVVEKFQKAPFEEIAAHCGARVQKKTFSFYP